MQQEFDLSIDVITGSVTDNEVGRRYVRGSLGIPAHNALKDAAGLLRVAAARIDPRRPAFGAA
jgi:hypothetical protein